jgi:hypothetical protein
MAKAEVFKAQVASQGTVAEIARANAAVYESNARVLQENARVGIAAAVAQAQVYQAEAQANAQNNEANSRAYAARTEAFRAVSSVYDGMGRLDIASFDSSSKIAIENVKLNLEQGRQLWDIKMKAATAGTDAVGKAMAGALNQVVGIATVDQSA